MLSINIPNVEPLFLHAFLRFYNVKLERMSLVKLKRGFTTSDQNLKGMITRAFTQFKQWETTTGKTLGEYMNRQIVLVYVTNGVANVTEKIISKRPLFIAKSRQNKNSYQHGEFGFTSKSPIQMNLTHIYELYNLPVIIPLTFETCPPSINLVKISDNVAFTDGDTPGHLKNSITIGISDDNYFWIPSPSIVQKRFYCTILPGICEVYFKTNWDLTRHMAICSDERKIKSYQVSRNEIIIKLIYYVSGYIWLQLKSLETCD